MKLTSTDFNMKVNESSSYIVYITKSKEIYSSIYQMEMKKRELLHDQLGWYYSVGGHAPVRALNSVVLPQFGFPASAILSSITSQSLPFPRV